LADNTSQLPEKTRTDVGMDTYAIVYRLMKIHPSLQSLIVSLKTAVVSNEWKLDKQQTSYDDDLLDSLRLSLCNYEFPKNYTP
jgi:hypothetical protein